MAASRACTCRLLLLLLVVTASIVAVPSQARLEDLGTDALEEVVELTGDGFDAHVFPSEGKPPLRPWFILFYAPWCAHCKVLLPQFANSSRLLRQSGVPHARFAVVNAVKHRELATRFDVHEYPTFIYTTGKQGRWHRFHGGYSMENFVQFGVYLQRSVDAGSFADIVSDPLQFRQVETEMADGRVPMFVYVPAKGTPAAGTRQAEARDAPWNAAVDAVASLGNIRFGVVYGDDVPNDWEARGSATYAAVVEAGRRCKGTGPGGEVFLAASDAYRRPQCYEEGPWLVDPGKGAGAAQGAGEYALHPAFEAFVTRHGFRAVEEMTPGLFSVISGRNHHYVGLVVTDGPLAQNDTTMMPVLRAVVQARNEARAAAAEGHEPLRHISLAHADGRSTSVWRMRYHIEPEELPAVVVVDPRRDKVYRLRRHAPRFEAIKAQLPWRLGGEQQEILAAFLDDVEKGKATGEKMTLIGDLAEYVLHLPGMEFVYETLGYEDALLVTMVFAFGFFCFLLFLALVVEPIMEKRMASHAKTD
ncbi:putative protein disulfide isomerase [Trypanosoma conorhini]|uniref:Thioredoxin domain-containing protein n=1 Tax=Trypanosoma conorhini TaxID=83891 RepID=A0A3R7MKU4_9TRYP|nr:putative protein disulfide isomerase [Trypanosoma conorhini]RNF16817.1 putative protein disulfide isomerase [Trypanosoma conorhini]